MSVGGKSFHKKDWAKVGLGVGLGATGLGAAGFGPLAGLLGSVEAGAGAAAGMGAGLTGADYAALGLGPAAEMGPGAAAGMGSGLTSADYAALTNPGSNLKNLQKAQFLMNLAKGFDQPQQVAQPAQRPQAAPPNETEIQALLKRLYGSNTWA